MSETLRARRSRATAAHDFAGQQLAQLRVRVAGKKAPQVLAGLALGKIMSEQALDARPELQSPGSDIRRAARCLMQAQRAAHAEVVGVDASGRSP